MYQNNDEATTSHVTPEDLTYCPVRTFDPSSEQCVVNKSSSLGSNELQTNMSNLTSIVSTTTTQNQAGIEHLSVFVGLMMVTFRDRKCRL